MKIFSIKINVIKAIYISFIILDFVIILLTAFSYLSFSKNKYEVKAGDIIEGK